MALALLLGFAVWASIVTLAVAMCVMAARGDRGPQPVAHRSVLSHGRRRHVTGRTRRRLARPAL